MGMSAGGDNKSLKNDINVTPLVDVVLVLLIIFMVTLPLKMNNETLVVPPEVQDKVNEVTKLQLVVTVLAGGKIRIKFGADVEEVPRAEFQAIITEKVANRNKVFVDCEDMVTWDECITVMDAMQRANDNVTVQIKLRDPDDAGGKAPAS